jgi:hypothetical protein
MMASGRLRRRGMSTHNAPTAPIQVIKITRFPTVRKSRGDKSCMAESSSRIQARRAADAGMPHTHAAMHANHCHRTPRATRMPLWRTAKRRFLDRCEIIISRAWPWSSTMRAVPTPLARTTASHRPFLQPRRVSRGGRNESSSLVGAGIVRASGTQAMACTASCCVPAAERSYLVFSRLPFNRPPIAAGGNHPPGSASCQQSLTSESNCTLHDAMSAE